MRIAVTYENGNIFQHFGHTERFNIYDVEKNTVKLSTTVNTNGSGHGALADVLKKINVDTLICGNIGDGARRALAEANIRVFAGVTGDADKAVEDFLANRLQFNPNAKCDHHGEHHEEKGGAHECHCGD